MEIKFEKTEDTVKELTEDNGLLQIAYFGAKLEARDYIVKSEKLEQKLKKILEKSKKLRDLQILLLHIILIETILITALVWRQR